MLSVQYNQVKRKRHPTPLFILIFRSPFWAALEEIERGGGGVRLVNFKHFTVLTVDL